MKTQIYLVNEETGAILESVGIFRFMRLTSETGADVSNGNPVMVNSAMFPNFWFPNNRTACN
jgi:hypothetical protein